MALSGKPPSLSEPWVRPFVWLMAATLTLLALRLLSPIVLWGLNLVSPFLVALVLAYVFNPVVNFVQQKLRLGRIAGILTLAGIIAVAFAAMAVWLIPVVYEQLTDLIHSLRTSAPAAIERFLGNFVSEKTIADLRAWVERTLGAGAPGGAVAAVGQITDTIKPMAQQGAAAAGTIAGGLLAGVMRFGAWIAAMVLIIIVTFYYLADMDEIPSVIRRLLPDGKREQIWDLMLKADKSVGGFLRGQLMACAAVGGLSSIGLFAIGLKQYAILIGVFAGIANFIPYLGPVAGATPAVLWALTSSSLASWDERGLKIGLIAGTFALVQTIDGMLMQPLVVGRHASLHPLAVILALAVGSQAGIGGMILAVPAACVVKVLWTELYWNKRKDFPASPPSVLQRKNKKKQSPPPPEPVET